MEGLVHQSAGQDGACISFFEYLLEYLRGRCTMRSSIEEVAALSTHFHEEKGLLELGATAYGCLEGFAGALT